MFALRFQSVEFGFWQSACGCDSNTRFPIGGHRPPGSGTTRQQNNCDDKTSLQERLVVLSLNERRQNYQFEDKRKSPEQLRLSTPNLRQVLLCGILGQHQPCRQHKPPPWRGEAGFARCSVPRVL
jgi:hypothetical protein